MKGIVRGEVEWRREECILGTGSPRLWLADLPGEAAVRCGRKLTMKIKQVKRKFTKLGCEAMMSAILRGERLVQEVCNN
jgi:hypothetical protein